VTDVERPRRRGPKRANYIRKVFALRKKDDVRKYVVRREVKKGDKTFFKVAKIQRLITEKRIRRKKLEKRDRVAAFKGKKEARAKYEKVLSQYIKERKALHHKHEEPVAEQKKAEPVKVQAKAKVEAKAPVSKPVEVKKVVEKVQAKAPQKKSGK
jgi:hypothetical protein